MRRGGGGGGGAGEGGGEEVDIADGSIVLHGMLTIGEGKGT